MAYETLKAQIADLNGDLGVHQRLLPGAFWKKTRGGFGVFPFFFPRTCTKKTKNTRKKTGFVFFLGSKALTLYNLAPPKKKWLTTWKGLFFFWGGGGQTRPYHWTPFFCKALWRLRRHLCPDHHLSAGHHPPENAGVTPWQTNMAGWKMDPLTMYLPIENGGSSTNYVSLPDCNFSRGK